jgi:hypothetical protein
MSQVLMILDLNGRFSFPPIHQRRVLSELYSGELSVSLDLVRPCLLRVGDDEVIDSSIRPLQHR